MIIRKATTKDLEIIKKLNQELFFDNNKFDETLDINWPKKNLQYYKSKILGSESTAFVALINKKVEGYLIGSICKWEDYRKISKMAEIENMLVNSNLRGKGIGTKLIQEFLHWAKDNDVTRVRLSVYAKNTEAIKFYKKNGFFDYSRTMEYKI